MSEKFEGFGFKIGMGGKPAIIVIDFINAFTDPESPLGGNFTSEVLAAKKLVDRARDKKIPVFYTTVSYEKNLIDAGNFIKKVPVMDVLLENTPAVEIDERIARKEDSEPLIVKKYASAFFGTSLHSMLAVLKVDTLIIVGATTSGCVRASVVDGLQYGYRVVVPEECVGDRSPSAHQANLYDINTKYGDVESLEKVLEHIDSLELK